jgi:PTH1 family peptidyl-tRNA hydrolase
LPAGIISGTGWSMVEAHLIAGLGNPGAEYVRTRHNAGFQLLDRLAERWRGEWRNERRFAARLAQASPGGRLCWLCEPQTYMNASGEAVAAVARYYRVPAGSVLVVADDADLPLGTVRLRPEGSSGGHHGLESVEQHLGTRGYARLRLGIGRQPGPVRQIAGHVLGSFSRLEAEWFDRVLARAGEAVECWLSEGATVAMNRFNGVVTAPEQRQAE